MLSAATKVWKGRHKIGTSTDHLSVPVPLSSLSAASSGFLQFTLHHCNSNISFPPSIKGSAALVYRFVFGLSLNKMPR